MNSGRMAGEQPTESPGDGGDVAADRTPDTIQREIEQTRAELADTIDAIADRLSPRRVVGRGAHAVRSQLGGNGSSPNGHRPHAPRHAAPAPTRDAPKRPAELETGPRQLRTDRVLLLTGLLAALAGVIILWRNRD